MLQFDVADMNKKHVTVGGVLMVKMTTEKVNISPCMCAHTNTCAHAHTYNNDNFIVQLIEWKYILHFGG